MDKEDSLEAAVGDPFPDPGQLSPRSLGETLTAFLECYAEPSLLGRPFCDVIGAGAGRAKFMRLTAACGFGGDPRGFCVELARRLASADGRRGLAAGFNGLKLPHLLLVAALEHLVPGNNLIEVRTTAQLEKLTDTAIPQADRNDLQRVIDTYPVRLSLHTLRQMRVSPAVARQYLPFVEELDPTGYADTWVGRFRQGLVEQMYPNRAIFLLTMSCPVYCRFCFRKHKDSRKQKNPTSADIQRALDYVRRRADIKEVLVTGGDPFLNRCALDETIAGLMSIPQVQTLRLASRAVAYYPHLFLGHSAELLNYLKIKSGQLQEKGKRMEVATHFIHPDEISPDSLEIVTELTKSGISVYVQTPFLKGCNDQGPELARLFSLLRGAGAELHYIFIPCSPIHGNGVYATPISKGLQAALYLRAHLSDRAIPRMTTGTPIGKMDWHTSGWAVEQDAENEDFIWLRTPYTPDYFKAFAPLTEKPDTLRLNAEGTIDVRFMARMGDAGLFLGARGRLPQSKPAAVADTAALGGLQAEALADRSCLHAVVKTGLKALRRVHATRVEMDAAAGDDEMAYIKAHPAITDVVVVPEKDALDELPRIAELVRQLQGIAHLNAVRLRSLTFTYAPERYTKTVADRLGEINRLTVAGPLRLEIETRFLHSRELQPIHRDITAVLRRRGITVYANVPLLSDINDTPHEIGRIAYALRQSGIEFHHLYVAGLPLQEAWNRSRRIEVGSVIGIASHLRREGSGREIPRYIIRTLLGEVDFGLTSRLHDENGRVRVCLLPYDLAYYRRMDPDFAWPEGVLVDAGGRPVVAVDGLTASDGFRMTAPHRR
ncbi:MAG: radical SAM protein [Deltaproteobacteria bacterium]|nr:radical SAM protein [Deltaproteobacteria bacterium]